VNESHLIEELLGLLQKMNEERGVPQGESLENRNILQGNSPSDPNNRVSPTLNSNERRRTSEIATLFARTFVEYNKKYKKDEKPRTLISQARGRLSSPPPLPEKKSGMGIMGMVLAGLALLGASIGGIVASLTGFFGNGAVAGFVAAIGKVGMIGALKILAGTFLKKFALGFLKKLPIIGGIISLTQAVMAFKDGDIFKGIGYLISGLLNFVPIVGPWLSIGADLLISWAEGKGMFDPGGALSPENGWKTIKGWMATIGKTIMDNALYLPVIGTFKRFGMAYDAFKGGSIGEGLKQVGLGLITFFPGGGGIIKGIEVLAGWMDSAKEPEGNFQKDTSWLGRIKKWIVSKLNDLPEFLKVPMRWFGILDDGGNTGVGEFGNAAWQGAKDGTKMVSDFVGGLWEKIKEPLNGAMGGIIDFFSKTWDNIKEASQIGIDYVKEIFPNIFNKIKSVFDSVVEGIANLAKKVGNWIKTLNPFKGGNDTQNWAKDEETKLKKAKQAGYTSWEEYKASGWKWKTGNVVVDKAVKDITTENTSGNVVVDKAVKSDSVKNSLDDRVNKIIERGKLEQERGKLKLMSSKDLQVESITQLKEAAKIQIKLLGEISHWGKLSLMELKRMSGGGGNNNVSVNASMPSPPSQSLEMLGDNRNGYASSVYALA
jgi:hypothetical protein